METVSTKCDIAYFIFPCPENSFSVWIVKDIAGIMVSRGTVSEMQELRYFLEVVEGCGAVELVATESVCLSSF